MVGQLVFLMARQEKNSKEILLDVKDANLRTYAGTTVQTIPKAWFRRMDLRPFFKADLEIALVYLNGEPHIEIRKKRWIINETSV